VLNNERPCFIASFSCKARTNRCIIFVWWGQGGFSAKLKAWRAAHERAKGELDAARADLLRVVTLRQEAILLGIGLLLGVIAILW